jgi:hypothetical protein
MKVMQMVDKRFLSQCIRFRERNELARQSFDAGVPIINHDLSISVGLTKLLTL